MATGLGFNTRVPPLNLSAETLDFDASQPGTPRSPIYSNPPTPRNNPAPNPQELRIALERAGAGGNNHYTPYHTIQWNGKKYDLRYTHNDGNQTHTLGFTREDWEKIATEMKLLWDAKKAQDANFTFSVGRFDTDNGVWHQRTDLSSQTQSFDYIAGTNPDFAAIRPLAVKVKDLFRNNQVRAQCFESKPNPRPAQPPQPQPGQPPQPPDPLADANPPADPAEEPWYVKLKNKVGSAVGSVWDKVKSILPGSAPTPQPPATLNP